MAPIGQFGNVATFHGIPDTTRLSLPPNSTIFEMPKVNPGVPLFSQTGGMNSFPMFQPDVSQLNPSTMTLPASPFISPNLLMSCNFSFLNPQALALFFQLQQQQPTLQQPTTPMSSLNPFAHLMPMFSPAPHVSPQPMMSGVPMGTPTQPSKTPQQTASAPAFFHGPPVGSFNFPPISTTNPSTFTLVNNPAVSRPTQQQSFPQESISLQHPAFLLPPTLEPNQPPSLRLESPFDPNLPPVLEPELPCLTSEFDDFGGPPDLMPVQFRFADEPPLLEPEVRPESPVASSSQTSPLTLPWLPVAAASSTPAISATTSSSPTDSNPQVPMQIHPIIELMNRTSLLRSPTRFAVSTPAVAPVAPPTPTTPAVSVSAAASPPVGRGKRERSSSVDSTSDVMLKMPKLLPMTTDYQTASPEVPTRNDQTATFESRNLLDSTDDFNAPQLEDSTDVQLLSDVPTRLPLSNLVVSAPTVESPEGETPNFGVQPPLTLIPALLIADPADLTRENEPSVLSSSGVSSANSSLLAEDALSLNSSTRIKLDDQKELAPEPPAFVQNVHKVMDSISCSSSPAPLTPVHNTQIRQREVKKPKKRAKRRSGIGGRRKPKRVRSVSIKSNWQPVDEGRVEEVRLSHESQSQSRRCYAAIRHQREYEEVIRVRDCVRVRSAEGLENVGKIIRLFLDDSSGSICAQVLWYYAPAQVPTDINKMMHEKELLASRHCDIINVDAIEEHAFVLSFSEYCRFVAETRIDEMPPERRPLESCEVWSRGDENYQRRLRLPHEDTPIDLVYFCRNVFSVRTRKICVSGTSRRGSKSSGSRRPTRTQR